MVSPPSPRSEAAPLTPPAPLLTGRNLSTKSLTPVPDPLRARLQLHPPKLLPLLSLRVPLLSPQPQRHRQRPPFPQAQAQAPAPPRAPARTSPSPTVKPRKLSTQSSPPSPRTLHAMVRSFPLSCSLLTRDFVSEGDQACVDSQFAQCVGGKFALTSCGSGIVCAALPLVNSAGTSITCDTLADAVQRIENTGATGGLTGDGSSSSKATPSAANNAVQTSSAAAASSSSSGAASSSATTIQQQNAHDAQALNKEFATLAEGDSCDGAYIFLAPSTPH